MNIRKIIVLIKRIQIMIQVKVDGQILVTQTMLVEATPLRSESLVAGLTIAGIPYQNILVYAYI